MQDVSLQLDVEQEDVRVFVDVGPTGKERPWREKKVANELLAAVYDTVDPSKALRLRDCGTNMLFQRNPENGRSRLKAANFCRVRLCPICIWRRSLKTASQVTKVIGRMGADYSYIMLNLTVRNCEPGELSRTLDEMMRGWQRLVNTERVKKAVAGGWYRAMEITHNLDRSSKDFDTYHPHFHCLLAVRKGYFSGGRYLPQAEWMALWRRSMRLNYDPNVDVRRVKGEQGGAVAEVAKYTVSEDSYIIPHDWELTIDTVTMLDVALNKRRFIAFGGLMRELHAALELDDPEDGDLVHVDNENTEELSEKEHLIPVVWFSGYRQYFGKYDAKIQKKQQIILRNVS